jgi:NAD(P)-dependent dehydrogenase (short-subunit alcohol dehydrogenase family)
LTCHILFFPAPPSLSLLSRRRRTSNPLFPFSLTPYLPTNTVLITGISPNSIGSALAHALAPHSPALLLLASRTPSNIRAVTQSIHASHAAVPVREVALDLSSQASVRTAAAAIRAIIVAGLGEGDGKGNARGERGIDVIFNNAGINISERRLSVDGVELQFATNHLGPFLLTNLLLPLLLQPYSSPAKTDRKRIVNTSSESHRISPIRFSDINQVPGAQVAEADKPRRGLPKGLLRDDGRYEPAVAYGVSKTANVLMAVELNRALGGRGVKSLAVMPGSKFSLDLYSFKG